MTVIVFAGTPEFAVPSLRALLAADYPISAVYTQPDRPAGRGRRLRPSPVKSCALESGLAIYQPRTLRDPSAQAELAQLNPDLMVVVAYGLILPQAVLATPRLGCVNVHASLLPSWRGAAPIQRALLAGDRESGISIMQMDEGLDTGPVLARATCPIRPDMSSAGLHDELALLGARTLVQCLPDLVAVGLSPQIQDHALATYAAKLDKSEAVLDWTQPADYLERQIRAFNPWPVAQSRAGGRVLRIWQAHAEVGKTDVVPGYVLSEGRDGIRAATGSGILRLMQLQWPGKRVLAAADFINAHSLAGLILGQP